MTSQSIKVKITFTEPILGSASGDPALQEKFVTDKATTAAAAKEELEAMPALTPEELDEKIEKASTIFPRDDKGFFVWDYQVRGFIKESTLVLIELNDCALSKWSYKKAVDSFVFVNPRRVYIKDANGNNITKAESTLQRPLRASTMQGERIALARSELIPAGCYIECEIEILLPGEEKPAEETKKKRRTSAIIDLAHIKKCLDYGRRKGLGQWRSGGYGRFTWEEQAA